MNEDFVDLLRELLRGDVRFMVVGAHALAVHGIPRATGDLDVWIEPGSANAQRTMEALRRFGAPTDSLGVSVGDLEKDDTVVQIGLPPRRIDVLTSITGVNFGEAWPEHVSAQVSGLDVPFIGRAALIRNKRATGRTKDLADVEALEGE